MIPCKVLDTVPSTTVGVTALQVHLLLRVPQQHDICMHMHASTISIAYRHSGRVLGNRDTVTFVTQQPCTRLTCMARSCRSLLFMDSNLDRWDL